MRRAAPIALAALLALAPGHGRAQEAPPEPAAGMPDLAPGLPPAAAPLPAETLPTRITEVPGTWDLSRDGTNRRCVMTLLPDRGPAGQRVNFPAGCRRALPLVGAIAGWLYADDAVRFVDRDIRPVLVFKRRPDRRSYVSAVEGGETYSLVPLDIAGMRPPEPEPPAPEAALAPPSPPGAAAPGLAPILGPSFAPATSRAAPPATQPAPAEPAAGGAPRPGTYALDRFREQGTCRLALDGAGAVKILPGCHDDGIEVFNPVRWRYANGRMTVTAKRGHSIDLVPAGDERWRRDPEVGTTFVLRRVES